MSERIDHATEARAGIKQLLEISHAGSESHHRALQAVIQTDATLALVEQQRIANLIALFTATGSEAVSRDGVRRIASAAYEQLMEPGIKEALGL